MKNKKAEPPPRPFVIAEAGVNHNGDLRVALGLVEAAARAGADAVKFQTFKAEKLASRHAEKAVYQTQTTGRQGSQQDMLKSLELPRPMHRRIAAHCRKKGILFMSTPFDEDSADFLDELGMRIFKIPSGEITNFPLLAHIARKGKPVILSTGMSTLEEVSVAVAVISRNGDPPLTLLHCVSSYPAPIAASNLRAMKTMADAFGLPVGFSDHTPGVAVSVAATALGAAVIEKHFTLDKASPGPDHRMSLDPRELEALVEGIRAAASALGNGIKAPQPCEEDCKRLGRRSIVLTRGLKAGAAITAPMLALKRPGTGMPPAELEKVIGRRLSRAVEADTLLEWEMLQ